MRRALAVGSGIVLGGAAAGPARAREIREIKAAPAVAKAPGFTAPRAIWIAHWDNQATLQDGTLVWPLRERDKQYQGPHNRTVGGITLNIDGDLAGGPLAR